jgi:hypothetical protein
MTQDDSLAALERRLEEWSTEGTADFRATFGVMPGRWLQMQAECGSTLSACKRILLPDYPEQWWVSALTPSLERKRMKWSVEVAAVTEFSRLFTEGERAVAGERLKRLRYDPTAV